MAEGEGEDGLISRILAVTLSPNNAKPSASPPVIYLSRLAQVC